MPKKKKEEEEQLRKEKEIKKREDLTPLQKRQAIGAIPGRDITATMREEIRQRNIRAAEAQARTRPEEEFVTPTRIRTQAELQEERRQLQLAPSIEKARAEAFLEEKGFAEEKLPEAVELEEERVSVEKLPVVGPSFAVWGTMGQQNAIKLLKMEDDPRKQQALIQNPETAKELILQEIQQEEVEKGTSGSEKFGAFIESIPLIGPLAGKYAGAMLETPSANVDTVIKNIKESRGRVLKKYEAVRANLIDPYMAYQSILDEEENIYALEQRIKNLSLESAELIADADKLNVIEGKILRAKEVVFFAKQAAATALRGEPEDSAVEAWLMSEMKMVEEEGGE